MSDRRTEVKNAFHDALIVFVDPIMNGHGFKRIKKSLIYRRKVEYGVQKLDLNLGGYRTLSPYVWILSQAICDLQDEVFKTAEPDREKRNEFYKIRKGMLFKNLHNIVPLCERCRYYRYSMFEPGGLEQAMKNLRETMQNWFLPFMNSRNTYETFLSSDEFSHYDKIFACIHCKKYDEALKELALEIEDRRQTAELIKKKREQQQGQDNFNSMLPPGVVILHVKQKPVEYVEPEIDFATVIRNYVDACRRSRMGE